MLDRILSKDKLFPEGNRPTFRYVFGGKLEHEVVITEIKNKSLIGYTISPRDNQVYPKFYSEAYCENMFGHKRIRYIYDVIGKKRNDVLVSSF